MSEQERVAVALPRAGETWKYAWLFVTIVKAGPKRVTYQTAHERYSVATDRFMSRFSRTGLTEARR